MHKKTRFFEDLTVPRVKLFNMMKTNANLENVWAKEGTTYYRKKGEDTKVFSIRGLFEGRRHFKYQLNDVEFCFGLK